MDEVNKAERVAVDAVPCKRVEAMRKQIQTLEAKLTRQYKVVRWQGGLANVGEDIGKSLTIAKPSRPRNTGQSASDAGADNHAKEEADNNDTDSQSTFNYATPLSHNTKSLPLVDACHIAELAFDLRCAQDEEKKAIRVRKECERQVILARKKREGIEEKLRRVEGLQKRRADFVGLGRRVE
jgi:hypothetical protein